MNGMEQAGPGGAGTVTAACVWLDGEPTYEMVVYPALLRTLPWFRGGRDVAVVRGVSRDAHLLRITHPGPHRLLARPANRLDKLPPVRLRVPQLEYLRPIEQRPVPVEYRVLGGLLEITLPEWARAPAPVTAPMTSYADVLGGRL